MDSGIKILAKDPVLKELNLLFELNKISKQEKEEIENYLSNEITVDYIYYSDGWSGRIEKTQEERKRPYNKILINANLEFMDKVAAITHEILHGISNASGGRNWLENNRGLEEAFTEVLKRKLLKKRFSIEEKYDVYSPYPFITLVMNKLTEGIDENKLFETYLIKDKSELINSVANNFGIVNTEPVVKIFDLFNVFTNKNKTDKELNIAGVEIASEFSKLVANKQENITFEDIKQELQLEEMIRKHHCHQTIGEEEFNDLLKRKITAGLATGVILFRLNYKTPLLSGRTEKDV